jgi:hypothetical protein
MVGMMMIYPVVAPNVPGSSLAKTKLLSGIPPEERGSQSKQAAR